ncbi:hypothetical protein R1sor_013863 [Riccia sorocarpa]|uniref:Uncharacterized protein n=1 Tax=Riccia sorocarpa TaxID=122646 RepID=A0ABD3HAN5_9MARC
MWQDSVTGLQHIEKTADKWAQNGKGRVTYDGHGGTLTNGLRGKTNMADGRNGVTNGMSTSINIYAENTGILISKRNLGIRESLILAFENASKILRRVGERKRSQL